MIMRLYAVALALLVVLLLGLVALPFVLVAMGY